MQGLDAIARPHPSTGGEGPWEEVLRSGGGGGSWGVSLETQNYHEVLLSSGVAHKLPEADYSDPHFPEKQVQSG